jgi:hypothetical protein
MTRMGCFGAMPCGGPWRLLSAGRFTVRSLASVQLVLGLLRMAIFVLFLVALGPLRTPLRGSNEGQALCFNTTRACVTEPDAAVETRSTAPPVLTCTAEASASESDDDSDDPGPDPIVGFEVSGFDAARCNRGQAAVRSRGRRVSPNAGRPSAAPEPPPPRAT